MSKPASNLVPLIWAFPHVLEDYSHRAGPVVLQTSGRVCHECFTIWVLGQSSRRLDPGAGEVLKG